jgi:hypothetical protein
VLLFTLGLALFVSLVIGLIPVIKYSGVALHTGLRESGRALSQGRERLRARKVLVVAGLLPLIPASWHSTSVGWPWAPPT